MVILLAIFMWLIVALISTVIGTCAWNFVMPSVFGLPSLTYVQFFVMVVAIRCLFPVSTSASTSSK